jgi:pyruvate dehydrogenase E1 component
MLHPDEKPRRSYIQEVLAGAKGPIVSSSDNVRAVGEQLLPYIEQDYYVLGTDGMGRSETRQALRRHFEVDATSIVIAALYRLSKQGSFSGADVAKAIKDLEFDSDKKSPLFA